MHAMKQNEEKSCEAGNPEIDAMLKRDRRRREDRQKIMRYRKKCSIT
jgi:hypothetical protein